MVSVKPVVIARPFSSGDLPKILAWAGLPGTTEMPQRLAHADPRKTNSRVKTFLSAQDEQSSHRAVCCVNGICCADFQRKTGLPLTAQDPVAWIDTKSHTFFIDPALQDNRQLRAVVNRMATPNPFVRVAISIGRTLRSIPRLNTGAEVLRVQ